MNTENQYVYKVYDFIAPHFSETRYKPWPVVVQFLESFQKYSFIADVGCGNGKYFGVNPNIEMFGSDMFVFFVYLNYFV
jgi:ubiquinone/menaquinone biosynthesis C-methylase UbiE